jgi:two-component system, NarL family, response regulator NreC
MSPNKITILLVDDHQMLREGLRALLDSEDDMQVISEADTGAQAIQLGIELKPDIIVMDLGLPDMNGVTAIRAIREQNRKSQIIVLSMYANKAVVMQSIEAGCAGYVPKSSAHTDLLEAIHTVLSGKRFLHPMAATALVESITADQPLEEKFESLSKREQEVLRLTAWGFNSREIGEKLFLSAKTVETYRQRAMLKLGLQHRSDLVEFALKIKMLNDDQDHHPR